MGNVFPSHSPNHQDQNSEGILQEEFRKGLGGNLFPNRTAGGGSAPSPSLRFLLTPPPIGS